MEMSSIGMQGGYKKKYEIEQDRDSDWTVAADDTSRSFALCNYMQVILSQP